MKPQIHASALIALVVCSATCHSAVIASWDSWGGYNSPTTSYASDQNLPGFTAGISVGSDRISVNFNSTDGTFGMVSGAATTGNALILSDANNALTVTITLTNNTGLDYNLASIHFDFAARENGSGIDGPRDFSLSYTSGALGASPVLIGSQANLPIWITSSGSNAKSNYPDYDLSLSPALSDTILGNGESAVFTLVLSNFQNTSVGSVLDNVAFVGEVIPEPVSGTLAVVGGLLLLGSRRRGQIRHR